MNSPIFECCFLSGQDACHRSLRDGLQWYCRQHRGSRLLEHRHRHTSIRTGSVFNPKDFCTCETPPLTLPDLITPWWSLKQMKFLNTNGEENENRNKQNSNLPTQGIDSHRIHCISILQRLSNWERRVLFLCRLFTNSSSKLFVDVLKMVVIRFSKSMKICRKACETSLAFRAVMKMQTCLLVEATHKRIMTGDEDRLMMLQQNSVNENSRTVGIIGA